MAKGSQSVVMESTDSRKRPLDGEAEGGVSKRSNQGAGGSTYLKDLVSNVRQSHDSSLSLSDTQSHSHCHSHRPSLTHLLTQASPTPSPAWPLTLS